ncbi:substrate-binding domain-containing protein [Streptomyces sp. AK02-01A]|uniref:substrate-binding domain-containing protein n=1 Tax=Streptomyces sp. AK02-01A TaxID=3028648 RepID=UPI0029A7F087|nr:substrate-binding domain-containing protein [Streptomyces sp. AK02-01A]MDX3851704.1 substrate-binding domain-containing protein [Streptomyces sp. AK02-01A]
MGSAMHTEASGLLTDLNTVIDSREMLTTLVCALLTGAIGLLIAAVRRRRRLSWSVLFDEPINRGPAPPNGLNMWEISSQGREIEDGSLVVLDIRNSGGQDIEESHLAVPLHFTFPGREVVHFKVRDSDDLHDLIERSTDTLPPDDASKIALPALPLNRREGFKLLVLLVGSGSGVRPGGIVRSGRIVQRTKRSLLYQVAAAGAVMALLIGVSGGVWLANQALNPVAACANGTLRVEGSTAFAPIATQVKNAYEQSCPNATIAVVANGSGTGLRNLRASKSTAMVAMSDGRPAQLTEDAGLTRRAAGVVVFAVVANRQLESTHPGLFNEGLTTEELRAVFSGANGYKAVGRSADSGTRAAFDSAFLGGTSSSFDTAPACDAVPAGKSATTACTAETTMDLLNYVNATDNAIGYAEADALPFFPNIGVVPVNGHEPIREDALSGKYPFVATEYLYTAGAATGLTANYLEFLTSDAMTAQLRGHGYIGCSDLGDTKLDGACTDN